MTPFVKPHISADLGTISSGNEAFVTFGPYMPGDYIESVTAVLRVILSSSNDAATIRVKVFNKALPIGISAAEWDANGRELTGGASLLVGNGFAMQALASEVDVESYAVELPLGHWVTDSERFIVIRMGGVFTFLRGSLWMKVQCDESGNALSLGDGMGGA